MIEQSFVRRSAIRQVVRDEFDILFKKVLAEAIGQSIASMVNESEERMGRKLAQFMFKGQWSEGTAYQAGNFVSMDGLWHCNHGCTNSPPGADNANWSLVIGEGR